MVRFALSKTDHLKPRANINKCQSLTIFRLSKSFPGELLPLILYHDVKFELRSEAELRNTF